MDSWEAPRRFNSCRAGARSWAAIARKRCSVETYSSLKPSASLKAPSSTSFNARPICCWAKPCTFGNRAISRSISCDSASLRTPKRASSGSTTPSACDTNAASKCTGSICWFSWRAATSGALCAASCALTVIVSNRNMATSFSATNSKKGLALWPAPNLPLHCKARPELPFGSSRSRSSDVDLDLLGLGLLFLRDAERQHPVLIVCLDGFRIHGVRQREASSERAVRALATKIVLFVDLLFELALTPNPQNIVLHTDVQILGIDFRQIGLDDQFKLGLVDVNRRRPGREAGLVSFALKNIGEPPINLVLQRSGRAEGFQLSKSSHDWYTS